MLFHIAGSNPGLFQGFPAFWAWHVLKQQCAQRSRTQLMSLIHQFTLLWSCFHSSLARWGVGFSLDVGGIWCQPYSDCPWDSFKWDWHDLTTYLWVCAVSQSWDWRIETQCPRLFTATDHVTSDQPLSLKTPSFSPHRPGLKTPPFHSKALWFTFAISDFGSWLLFIGLLVIWLL